MAIIIALARQVLATLTGGVGRRALIAGGVGALAGQEIGGGGFPGFFGLPFGGGDGEVVGFPRRRRRRRKALTSDDVRLALTIASAISKKAAENFILTRTRGS